MESPNLEQFTSLLSVEKDRLEKGLAAFATKDPLMRDDWDTKFPSPVPMQSPGAHSSQDEQADIREEYETELAQEQALELRLQEVNRALERIRSGTFGLCKTCGGSIPNERLSANPAAEYDIEHEPRE